MADEDEGGKKEPDQSGGLAKSFDQYEYVAVITPGATLLFGLMILWPALMPGKTGAEIGLGALGLFLIAAYVAGHILRAIGDVAERQVWDRFGGMPTEWVLHPDPAQANSLLGEQRRTTFRDRVKEIFGVDMTTLDVATNDNRKMRREKFDRWQAVTREINTKVRDAQQKGRINAFNRTYGLMD